MQEKRALGKGLSSLIPMGHRNEAANKNYAEVSPTDVIPNQNQPRKLFDKTSIDELAASIEQKGIIQPLVVRTLGGGKYELIAGERRLRAAQLLKLEKVPVVIKDVDENETLELALIENIQRQDLNPIEEALAYKDLLGKYQYTQDELAKRVGKDRSSIANSLRLLKLPEEVRGQIISGQISMGHARALLAIESREMQQKIANEIVKNGASVREVEELMRKMKEAGRDLDISDDQTKSVKVTPIRNLQPFKQLEEELRSSLKTKVEIKSPTGRKGKLVIHFHSADELEGLSHRLK